MNNPYVPLLILLALGFGFAALSVGTRYACARRVDGSAHCWGVGPEAPAGQFAALDVRRSRACGVRNDGSVECWGPGGQPAPLPAGSYTAVGTGSRHTCGLRQDGAVVCAGPLVLQPPR